MKFHLFRQPNRLKLNYDLMDFTLNKTLIFLILIFCSHGSGSNYCSTEKYYSLYKGNVCGLAKDNLLEIGNWSFSQISTLLEELPFKQERDNYIGEVHGVSFSAVQPTALTKNVRLVAICADVLANILDFNPNKVKGSTDFIDFVAGNKLLRNSFPIAHRYGGHQFGEWAGQLGDGRAILLGEYINRGGDRWELQLKGSGKTPYSRRGDGRAVLRSSVREFVASEAMYHLHVPTSRAASLVMSGDKVWRDQFYDGHPKMEHVAVVLRLSPSWFRIGSLEILTMAGEHELLRKTVDLIINQHFQHLQNDKNKYEHFFSNVVRSTAEMVAKWQSVGFTHGVCNTDNFSVLSLTIDYGPFGFMEGYNPKFVPNTSDDEGRYSYENQPNVGYFNMDKLRLAMAPLLDKTRSYEILRSYSLMFTKRHLKEFRQKLGILGERKDDKELINSLLWIMSVAKADFTMTFRGLSELTIDELRERSSPKFNWALKRLSKHANWSDWVKHYYHRLQMNSPVDDDKKRRIRMQKCNPRYILRNWMAQIAIEKAEKDDFTEVHKLLKVLENPFEKQVYAELAGYASPPPSWADRLRVSCSS